MPSRTPTVCTADYLRRPRSEREQMLTQAREAAIVARHSYADLLIAEAAIAIRRSYPQAARIKFRLATEPDGTSASLIAVFNASGRPLWTEHDSPTYDDDSELTDHLAAASDWYYTDLHSRASADPDVRELALPARPTPTPPAEHVRRLLDLSTAHLPAHLATDGLEQAPGVVAHKLEYGWLLCVPDDPDDPVEHPQVPAEVRTIQRYARARGCDYVMLDADGDLVEDLPTWDWA